MVAFLVVVAASVLAAPGDQSLTVRGGVVVFNRPAFDSVSLVEFPFVLTRNQFEFFRPDTASGTMFARVFAQVNLYGVDGLPLDSSNTYFSAAASDSVDALRPDYSLFNSLVLVVRPGVYSARLTVIDAVSKRQGECFLDRVSIDPPIKDRLSMGGKCLAYKTTYIGDAPGMGVGVPKNGYEVRCNPTGLFSKRDTIVAVYAEIYNLKYDSAAASDFVVGFVALDSAGKVFRQLGNSSRPKAGTSAVIVESFAIADWPTGSYVLQVTVADSAAGGEISYDFPMAIIEPLPVRSAAVAATEGDPCSSLDLETQKRLVYYLITPPDKAVMNSLTPDGQRLFVERFWQERDPDPATTLLENRLAMYQLYEYANNFFSISEGKSDGWFTDRGRIVMTYGEPEKSEDYAHPTSGHPYQIWWYYSLREGVVFVFQDRRGFGEFKLVHSNMPGERYDREWDEALKSGTLQIE